MAQVGAQVRGSRWSHFAGLFALYVRFSRDGDDRRKLFRDARASPEVSGARPRQERAIGIVSLDPRRHFGESVAMTQRLVALGDSITLGHWDENGGWLAELRRTADARVVDSSRKYYATVYNLGISSNTSTHVVERYCAEVSARHNGSEDVELFIVLAVGINDSAVIPGTEDHLVDPDRYETNMKRLSALARKQAGERVVIVGLTPVDESKTRPVTYRDGREYRLDFIEAYNEIARRVAYDCGVHFVDLWAGLRPHDGHWHEWDGVHLNAVAHQRVGEIIESELTSIGWGDAAIDGGGNDTRDEVIAVLHRLGRGIAAADVDAVLREFASSETVVMFGSEGPETAYGRSELAALWARVLSRGQSYIWNWRDETVAFLGSVAWLSATATVSLRDSTDVRELAYRATLVLVRERGRWVVVQYHGSEPAASW
jgi:lysophospholipase L1-like esterase